MKKKEKQELKNKPVVELEKLAKEYREKLGNARFDFVNGKLQNVRTLREIRRDLARVLTVLQATKTS